MLVKVDRQQQVASIPEENVPTSQSKEQKVQEKRSILIPTIVGKSVVGSAQHALLQSRARARASTTRTAPVSQRAPQKTRDNQNSAAKSGSKTQSKLQPQENTNSEKGRLYLPALLLKEFMALQSFIAAKSLRRSQTVGIHQSTLVSWFCNLNGKELPFLSMDTILGHATGVQTTIFHLVQPAVANPIPFILYFAKTAFPDSTKNITISKNFVWNNEKATGDRDNPTMYLMKQIISSKRVNVHMIHEICCIHLKGIGKTGRCRSWVLISSKDSNDIKPWIKDSDQRAVKSFARKKCDISKREKESNRVTKTAKLALLVLHPSLKMFMFALNILRRVARGEVDDNTPSPTQLLRETMSTFSANTQIRYVMIVSFYLTTGVSFLDLPLPGKLNRNGIGTWYRLLSRTVIWGQDIIDAHSFDKMLKYIGSKPSTYDIVDCSKDELCISGSVPCDFKDGEFNSRFLSSSLQSAISRHIFSQFLHQHQ